MGDRVGIYAVNCKEWYISQQACAMRGIIFVPLYDTHGADAIEFIIRQCDIRVMFTTSDKVVKIFENSDKYPSLSKIVVMDILSDNLSKIANEYPHIDIIDFDNIEADGIANPEPRPDTITQDTVVSICYTSGTRNDVKGAILTQGNYLSVVSSLVAMSEKGQIFKLQTSDIHMSYLPLPHIYEQTLHMIVSYSGARIGYYQGDVIKLMEDVQELKPTIFAAVPRMYNRIYERIQRSVKLKSIWSQFVFNYGILVKSQYIKKGYYKHSFLDKSVFEKIRHLLGGNVRALVCGAAPINPKIAAFFSICFSAEFTEGYGTTESCGLATNVHQLKLDLAEGRTHWQCWGTSTFLSNQTQGHSRDGLHIQRQAIPKRRDTSARTQRLQGLLPEPGANRHLI
ncbi:hypothetical protein EDD86DRAFT_115037 [Gorgonomyces haynaldii]|nr:hypothetical protein EDD86DRAFT_115037 [Gorgonomyces haynaldii]